MAGVSFHGIMTRKGTQGIVEGAAQVTSSASSRVAVPTRCTRARLASRPPPLFLIMADMEVDPPAAAPAKKDDEKKRFEVKKVRLFNNLNTDPRLIETRVPLFGTL